MPTSGSKPVSQSTRSTIEGQPASHIASKRQPANCQVQCQIKALGRISCHCHCLLHFSLGTVCSHTFTSLCRVPFFFLGLLPRGRWYGILVVPLRARGTYGSQALCFRQLGGDGFTFKGPTNLFPGPAGPTTSLPSVARPRLSPASCLPPTACKTGITHGQHTVNTRSTHGQHTVNTQSTSPSFTISSRFHAFAS